MQELIWFVSRIEYEEHRRRLNGRSVGCAGRRGRRHRCSVGGRLRTARLLEAHLSRPRHGAVATQRSDVDVDRRQLREHVPRDIAYELLHLLEEHVEGARAEDPADRDGQGQLEDLPAQRVPQPRLPAHVGGRECEECNVEAEINGGEDEEPGEHRVLGEGGRGSRIDVEGAQREQLRLEHAQVRDHRREHHDKQPKPHEQLWDGREQAADGQLDGDCGVEQQDHRAAEGDFVLCEVVAGDSPALGDHEQADDKNRLAQDHEHNPGGGHELLVAQVPRTHLVVTDR